MSLLDLGLADQLRAFAARLAPLQPHKLDSAQAVTAIAFANPANLSS